MHILKARFLRWLSGKRDHIHKNDLFQTCCLDGQAANVGKIFSQARCPHFNSSLNLAKVHVYGAELYPKLEKLTGQAVSWHGCGGLRLAATTEEVDWLKYVYGISRLAGYECEILGPSEIGQYHPFLDTFGVKAAFRTVNDGHVAPADITNAMATGARQLGAEIYRRTLVTDVRLLSSGKWAVVTDTSVITCEHVVNAAGSYADVVGSWTGHNVLIANMLHHYLITEPVRELIEFGPELPVVRDPYSHSYLREETNGILIGPYETATAHVCWDGKPPAWDFESELVAPELDRLMPWLERAAERMPLFNTVGLKSIVSGTITHTPDGTYLRQRRMSGQAGPPPPRIVSQYRCNRTALGAFERLNGRLFVDREHDGVVGRGHVEPDDLGRLGRKTQGRC
jgi:dimethylglycine dehydrogenase